MRLRNRLDTLEAKAGAAVDDGTPVQDLPNRALGAILGVEDVDRLSDDDLQAIIDGEVRRSYAIQP